MKANVNIGSYISAKWGIEICKSGENGEITSRFPYGSGVMKNNAILDSWLQSIVYLNSSKNRNMRGEGRQTLGSFGEGFIQLGTGTNPISYSDRKLHRFVKETRYVRPFFNRTKMEYFTHSGMATLTKIYEFEPEATQITYTEAGFRQQDIKRQQWNSEPVQYRDPIVSRFLFTAEEGAIGFISGYINDSGFFSSFEDDSLNASGIIYNNKQIFFNQKSIRYEPITGFLSGIRYSNGSFIPFSGPENETDFSGYFIDGKKYHFTPVQYDSEPIIGFVSGYMDTNGNFFELDDINYFKASGYLISGQRYNFLPQRYLQNENIVGYLSGFVNEYGEFTRNIENGSSGYFINNKKVAFKSVNFTRFDNESGFIPEYGYQYNGFDYLNSGFVGEEIIGNEKVIGYLSGYRNPNGAFTNLILKRDSGYFINGVQKSFSKINFSGFSGLSDFNLGFNYTGFSFPDGSGFSGIQFLDSGYGIMTGYIGDRNYLTKTYLSTGSGIMTGYIGNRNYLYQSGIYSGISGIDYFENGLGYSFSGFPFASSGFLGSIPGYGIMTGSIGSNTVFKYYAPFNGFSGLFGFDDFLGYEYSGFFVSGFGSGFNALISTQATGSGYYTGIIGYRNFIFYSPTGINEISENKYGYEMYNGIFTYQPINRIYSGLSNTGFSGYGPVVSEKIIGYQSGYKEFGIFNPYTKQDKIGLLSGYIINGTKYPFTNEPFSGFSGIPYFAPYGFVYSGFSFPEGSVFSGINNVVVLEYVNGFISGFMNQYGEFFDYDTLYPFEGSGASGIILNGEKYKFPSLNFSGFSGMPGFSDPNITNFKYSGFFHISSGFSGTEFSNSGHGIYTGYIGYKISSYQNTNDGEGILTGFIGHDNKISPSTTGILTGIAYGRKVLSGIKFDYGEYAKITYAITMRIPAMVDPIPVTGKNVVYGDFNGSGSIKLVGEVQQIFGTTSDKGSETIRANAHRGGGFWWQNAKTHFNHPDTQIQDTHLSASMLKSTYQFPAIGNTMFVSGNSSYSFVAVGQPEINPCDTGPQVGIEQTYKHRAGRVVSYSNFTPHVMVYPLGSNNLLIENYPQTQLDPYPNYIDYTFIFPGDYPPSDILVGGFAIGASIDFSVTKDDCFKGLFYSKLLTGESMWVYKFDTPQSKNESQLLEFTARFSVNRDETL